MVRDLARVDPAKERRKEAAARFRFTLRMSWAEKSGRAFRLDELPGLPALICKRVGADEKEIKAIVGRWLR